MAMTKAEQARLEALQTELALRWPTFDRPAPLTPVEIACMDKVTIVPRDTLVGQSRTVTVVWFCNAFSGEVTRGWVEGHLCSRNDPNLRGAGASRFEGYRVFRTEQDAWREMRWAASEEAAKKLRAIDIKEPTQ